MRIQTITLNDFRRRFGTLDTARAIHFFTSPLDTNVVLTLLSHAQPRRILEIGTALGHMTANLTEWSHPDSLVYTIGTIQDLPFTGPQQQRCNSPRRSEHGFFIDHFARGSKATIITADSLFYDFSQLSPIDFAFVDLHFP